MNHPWVRQLMNKTFDVGYIMKIKNHNYHVTLRQMCLSDVYTIPVPCVSVDLPHVIKHKTRKRKFKLRIG